MIFCYLVAAIVLVLSIACYTGRAIPYIKGYQAMTPAEQRTIRIDALCKNLGIMLFLAATIFAVAGYYDTFREHYLTWAMLGFFILGWLDILFINKAKRYRRDD